MKSSLNYPLMGKVKVDKTYEGEQDDKALGRNKGKKKIMKIGIERVLGGVSLWWYERVIENATKNNLVGHHRSHKDAPQVITDSWSGYKGMETHFPNLILEKPKNKSPNFNRIH